ncbi:hypothetical protein M951_chr3166 (nucleomorph) [Lotharella oceanica]|uniref:Uncharacterized protein n=1 Tax=Lotharella oceanica TaxID=641309 RepID=A0A060D699_9EUKA|nr:hypothetical protein M951_chr139 [Lotharella oceanica]AIB09671.1 hypothetical protein M951_chr1192 [Lotharella oceanica]AIB09742.1 hypothetical protein M951_chr239 [Lotharella oceanica]AIB09874.1 hypothetical protein M951_chr2182 [Lotharella oceanica]AIB09945.1 hypothetical protein M951_chr339 [Lotharella oceanica]
MTKYTDCLAVYRTLPPRCLTMKARQMTLLCQTYNSDAAARVLLPGTIGNTGLVSVRPRYATWVSLLEGSRITWIVDNKSPGKIYVMHDSWELAGDPFKEKRRGGAKKKGAGGGGARMQELCTVPGLIHGYRTGMIPPQWSPHNPRYNFHKVCSDVFEANQMDISPILGVACGKGGVQKIRENMKLSFDPNKGNAYVGIKQSSRNFS